MRRSIPTGPVRAGLSIVVLLTTPVAVGLAADPEREGAGESGAAPAVRYSRDVRPLLSDRCFPCHGPDAASRAADLRLDTFEFATVDKGYGAAIVPGDPEASEVWYRITTEDELDAMPPQSAHRTRLSEGERDTIRRWIAEGADYEDHWAFVAPTRPPVPGRGGDQNPIDAFVHERLAAAGLAPSPEERPDLLLRRVFLDLTGLPPTLEELDAFLAEYDPADGEAERTQVLRAWVRRIFEEEPYRSRYAERMATPWLDQARFADTSGIHMDAGRQIWPWRDWVLEAYRENMPFDQFLTEQLAGDLIPDATLDQLVASGFNRNHVTTDEGGAIDAEYLVEYAVDRVDTTGQVFLGLTMGCARCHDHKFDPVTQRDFFRFFAFFNSNDEPGLYTQQPDANRAFEPFIEVPSDVQLERREELAAELEAIREELSEPSEEDRASLAQWRAALPAELGLAWADYELAASQSTEGTTFDLQADGSILAGGPVPAVDVHTFTLRTEATDLRLLQLDALGHSSHTDGAPGRSSNGNAVLNHIAVEAVSVADPTQRRPLELSWAWADYAQDNDDYGILRAFSPRHNTGWAIAGHTDGSERSALFLSAEPFGFEGGTDVVVTLSYDSIWAGHAFGRVRLGLGSLAASGTDVLPVTLGAWYHAGPFNLSNSGEAYSRSFGPETDTALDPDTAFAADEGPNLGWTYDSSLADGAVNELTGGVNIHYVAREIYAPDRRDLEVSIGSDDGFALFVNGELVAEREVPRGVAPDQDRVTLPLAAGRNSLVFKIVNTGGGAGFYFRPIEPESVLREGLVAALVDDSARADSEPDYEPRENAVAATLPAAILHGWRLTQSEEYATTLEREAAIVAATDDLEASIPRTMVMRDRMEPRQAYILDRGEYDKADESQPTDPGVPSVFESPDFVLAADGARATRLDLARWMTDPSNPLVSRVAVNRIWQVLFGTGLVATSGDFGYQGSWPSHPELLDWLAVEFVDSGWDVQALIETIVTSSTYRQSSNVDLDRLALDPDNALLAAYPRRRLSAEAIRDMALYTSGLLVESFGGPSVKPYQPSGLWQEVAMLNSNTRIFERGAGDELWRRSLYTYWKRAAPPPAMMTFDAPVREFCVIQRGSTNTPLQALVLWNDEQFVEAARVMAQRALGEAGATADRLARLFRRCTSREPEPHELEILEQTLAGQLERYAATPADAEALLAVGEAMLPATDYDPAELAAWTLVASAVLNLHATITQG